MPRHLIHIGFPKAGSSALQGWFSAHPDLVHVPNGLAGHHGAEQLARRAAGAGDLDRWHVTSSEHLAIPRLRDGGARVAGDGPIAERRRRACELLRGLFGEATILIVTRGFRAMLASSYSQYVRTGGTMGPREFLLHPSDPPDRPGVAVEDHFDYDATVALYAGAFGPERTLVLPHELLRDDPRAFVETLERRLGVAPSGRLPARANPALTGAELYWYPRISRLAERATARMGARGPRALELYHDRIEGPDLGRGVGVLARLAPGRAVDPSREGPAEILERCRGRAAALTALPVYAPYAAEYLNDTR